MTYVFSPRYKPIYPGKEELQNAHSNKIDNSQQMHIHKWPINKRKGKTEKKCLGIKITELQLHIISWVSLKNIMLNKIGQKISEYKQSTLLQVREWSHLGFLEVGRRRVTGEQVVSYFLIRLLVIQVQPGEKSSSSILTLNALFWMHDFSQ